MVKENLIPKTETVYELKSEIPTYEEFMKTYENDDKVVNSYESELEAKAVKGPQYGPGKSDFYDLCRRIKNNLGSSLTCRISCDSDYFYSSSSYCGAIVYAINGQFSWQVSNGRACGRNGRAFYMIVRNTDGWKTDSSDYRYGIGGGIFHGYIIKDELGFDLSSDYNKYTNNIICCGGFAYQNRELKFNSYTLNGVNQIGGASDSSNEMSYWEKELVKYCFDEYKEHGPSYTINYIPSKYLP